MGTIREGVRGRRGGDGFSLSGATAAVVVSRTAQVIQDRAARGMAGGEGLPVFSGGMPLEAHGKAALRLERLLSGALPGGGELLRDAVERAGIGSVGSVLILERAVELIGRYVQLLARVRVEEVALERALVLGKREGLLEIAGAALAYGDALRMARVAQAELRVFERSLAPGLGDSSVGGGADGAGGMEREVTTGNESSVISGKNEGRPVREEAGRSSGRQSAPYGITESWVGAARGSEGSAGWDGSGAGREDSREGAGQGSGSGAIAEDMGAGQPASRGGGRQPAAFEFPASQVGVGASADSRVGAGAGTGTASDVGQGSGITFAVSAAPGELAEHRRRLEGLEAALRALREAVRNGYH